MKIRVNRVLTSAIAIVLFLNALIFYFADSLLRVQAAAAFSVEKITSLQNAYGLSITSITVTFSDTTGLSAGLGDKAQDANVGSCIKINGKTLTQIIANNPGTASTGSGNKVQVHFDQKIMEIYIDNSVQSADTLKYDGKDSLEITDGFKSPGNGNYIAGGVVYRYNVVSQGMGSGGWWSMLSTAYDISVVGIGLTVMEKNYYAVQILFDKNPGISDNVQNNEYVRNKIRLNGKSIGAINDEETAISPAITAHYQSGNLLTLYFKQNISAANNFKFDNTDVLEIANGFATINGGNVGKSYKYLYNVPTKGSGAGGSWATYVSQNGTDSYTEHDVTIVKVLDLAVMDKSFYAIRILFDQSLGSFKSVQEYDEIKNKIKINGKTVGQINSAESTIYPAVQASYGDETNVLTLYVKQNVSSANQLRFDGKDNLEIPSGFKTLDGGIVQDAYKFLYSVAEAGKPEKGSWAKVRTAYGDPITVSVISPVTELPESYAFTIRFSESAAKKGENFVQDSDYYIKNYLKINGRSFKEINDFNKDNSGNALKSPPATAHWLNSATGTDGYIILHLFLLKELASNYNFKMDGTDTIEIVNGFIAPCNKLVAPYKATYNKKIAKWTDKNTVLPQPPGDNDWTPIKVTSVSKPMESEDGSVVIKVGFDQPINYRPMVHLNAGLEWLFGISNAENPPFVYSETELTGLALYGVIDSVQNKIKINGKTILEYMDREKGEGGTVGNWPVSMMVHVGTEVDGLNFLTITFNATCINKTTASAFKEGDTVEVLSGFTTTLGGKTTEDAKYVMDSSGVFTNGVQTEQISYEIPHDKPWPDDPQEFPLLWVAIGLAVIAAAITAVFILRKKLIRE